MQKSYKPHNYQLEFHKSAARYRTIIAGRRAGKSIAGTIEALYWADQMPKKIGTPTTGIIVAPTYQDLNDVNVKMVMDWLPEKSIKDWNKSEMRLTLINGSEIVFRYADPVRIGRGRKYHWAWLDEASLYDQGQKVWETLRPSLTDYKGSTWITTTPQGKDWVYKTFYVPSLKQGDFKTWNFKTIDNPYIDPAEVEIARNTMSEAMFRQEYLASFESFSGLIYPDWNESMLIDKYDRAEDSLYFIGIDVGWEHPTGIVLIAEDKDHRLYVIDEVQKQHTTAKDVEKLIDDMITRNGLRRVDIQDFIIDPASKGTDQTSGMSMFDQLQDPTIVINPIPLVPGVNDVMAGINRVTEYLRANKLKITRGCKQITEQMSGYKWVNKRDDAQWNKPEVYKLNDDLVDPLRYVVMGRPDWSERIYRNSYNEPIIAKGEVYIPEEGMDIERGEEWGM
jgi:PBSX family phage terminase large subunit